MSGQGKYTWATGPDWSAAGITYEGEFSHGLPNGKGVMKWLHEEVNALPDEEEPEQEEGESEEDHAARVAEFEERYEAEVARKAAEDLN